MAAGFILLIGTFAVVGFTETPGLAVVGSLFAFAITFAIFAVMMTMGSQDWIFIKLRYDTEYRQRWTKRIRRRLHEQGYVRTEDFKGMGLSDEEINMALKMYFMIYEFQQDLMLNCYTHTLLDTLGTRKVCKLGFRSKMLK